MIKVHAACPVWPSKQCCVRNTYTIYMHACHACVYQEVQGALAIAEAEVKTEKATDSQLQSMGLVKAPIVGVKIQTQARVPLLLLFGVCSMQCKYNL